MKNVATICRRELRSWLPSPMAAVIAAVFMGLSGVFFVAYLVSTGYSDTSIQGFLSAAQYLVLFFAALLTMRLIAEERKLGTWELLATAPLRGWEVVLGKYLSALAVLGCMLALTLYFPFLLTVLGSPDPGPIIASYLGLALLGSTSVAIGIFASALTPNQVASAVVAGGMLFGLWFLGALGAVVPGGLGTVVFGLSLSHYFPDLARGIVDTRGVVYYISVTGLFLYLATEAVEAGPVALRWGPLVLALTGLASLLIGFILRLVLPDLRLASWVILGLGGALAAASVILDFRRLREKLTSPRGMFGIGALVRIPVLCGIVLLINAISMGSYHRFDLTSLSQFTLTRQTKQVLAGLREPVEAVNFYTSRLPATLPGYADSLLAEYRNYTRQLTVRDVDPEQHPDQARSYHVDEVGVQYGVTVFRGPAGVRVVYGPQVLEEAEHVFTSAILEVTGTRQKRVYFLTGHGEWGIMQGYARAASGLKDNLFTVGELDLLRTPEVPADASAVVVAGPRRALAPGEVEALAKYLRDGGAALMLLDPGSSDVAGGLLAEWGVAVEAGSIVDPSSFVSPDQDTPLVPAARDYFGLPETYFPGSASVIPRDDKPRNVQVAALVWTSPQSRLRRVKGEGAPGALAIGVLISAPTPDHIAGRRSDGTRLVVLGDSDFASDAHFGNAANGQLFLTIVNWLSAGQEVIALDRKVLSTRRLVLTSEQARFLVVTSIGLFPLLLLASAGMLWWRRRRR